MNSKLLTSIFAGVTTVRSDKIFWIFLKLALTKISGLALANVHVRLSVTRSPVAKYDGR